MGPTNTILEYFEPTPGFIVFAPFKPMRAQCEVCGRAYRKKRINHHTCGRPPCKREHCRRLMAIRNAKARGKPVDLSRKRKRRAREQRMRKALELPGQPTALCCGEPLSFGTDMLGRTTQICRGCGERPLPLYGIHKYDQRPRLEQELREKQDSAAAPVEPHEQYGSHGDGWRQVTHKKGIVEFLGEVA